jgi:hypothetical protein
MNNVSGWQQVDRLKIMRYTLSSSSPQRNFVQKNELDGKAIMPK